MKFQVISFYLNFFMSTFVRLLLQSLLNVNTVWPVAHLTKKCYRTTDHVSYRSVLYHSISSIVNHQSWQIILYGTVLYSPSISLAPVFFVFAALSLPAKSTKDNLPTQEGRRSTVGLWYRNKEEVQQGHSAETRKETLSKVRDKESNINMKQKEKQT